MTPNLWFELDPTLALRAIPTLPDAVRPVSMREQAIDTVLLRNLDVFCTTLFGERGLFLFCSTISWGSFDVAAVLPSGRIVFFENKSGVVSRDDAIKFARDINFVREAGPLYLAHRWQHHKDYWDYYRQTWRRMYAAFYLGLRCDSVPDDRDLCSEALQKIGIDLTEFDRRAASGERWIYAVQGKVTDRNRGHVGLWDYLKAHEQRLSTTDSVYALMATDCRETMVCEELRRAGVDIRNDVMLIEYRFFSSGTDYPTHLQQRHWRVPPHSRGRSGAT